VALRLRFDVDVFPVITVVFAEDGCSDEDIEHMIRGFQGVLRRREKFSVIIDGGGLTAIPNARQRARAAEYEREAEAVIRQFNVGSALVVDSALGRGVITALRWISKATAPEAVFATPAEAGRWCIAQLEAARVVVPQATRDYVASLVRGGSRALRSSQFPTKPDTRSGAG
jgi:hypothetical protein